MQLRALDAALITLALLAATYTTYTSSSLTLTPALTLPLDASRAYANGHYPLESERLPPPLVVDVAGDARAEIVLARPVPPSVEVHSLADGKLASASLVSRLRTSVSRRPVALGAGFVTPRTTASLPGPPRSRIVVVLTQDWTVLAFDGPSLEPLWETSLADEVPDWLTHRAAALLVTAADGGTVVVGGRVDGQEVMDASLRTQSYADTEDVSESAESGNGVPSDNGDGQSASNIPDDDYDTTASVAAANHFSYFALEGGSGKLKWAHSGASFHDDAHSPHYVPHVDGEAHTGEVPWREYRAAVLAHLPHRWALREHTSLSVAHFAKGAARPPTRAEGLELVHLAGISLEDFGIAPHDEAEHVVSPNVIVAHLEKGVEVLHLDSGATLLQLPLAPGAVYADVNGDGIIDKVTASTSPRRGLAGPDCLGVAASGTPTVSPLFNVSICDVTVRGELERMARG
ncbi:uncharacterized protein AMSG_08944, partial [Thecamonas trahens ATCC 50062]